MEQKPITLTKPSAEALALARGIMNPNWCSKGAHENFIAEIAKRIDQHTAASQAADEASIARLMEALKNIASVKIPDMKQWGAEATVEKLVTEAHNALYSADAKAHDHG